MSVAEEFYTLGYCRSLVDEGESMDVLPELKSVRRPTFSMGPSFIVRPDAKARGRC